MGHALLIGIASFVTQPSHWKVVCVCMCSSPVRLACPLVWNYFPLVESCLGVSCLSRSPGRVTGFGQLEIELS